MIYTTLIDAAALAAAENIVLFDCGFDLADSAAGGEAFREGHLPGARYLHLDDDLAGPMTGTNGRHPLPDPAVFAATMRAAGVHAGQQVVAYDDAGGPYAARLWWLLRWLGHDAVAVLDGGKQAWIEAGERLEAGDVSVVAPGDFAGPPDAAMTIDIDGVLANLASVEYRVVDARTPERFRGDPNPMDPVAGHIPGAVNRFFKDNLAVDGRFKPAAALGEGFAAVLGDTPPRATILQCGSGVTACHNALAMEVAGLSGARLYPGSWSEWIADPARPVSRDA